METVQRTFLFFVFSYFFREFRVMPAVHHREALGRRQDLPERSRKSNDLRVRRFKRAKRVGEQISDLRFAVDSFSCVRTQQTPFRITHTPDKSFRPCPPFPQKKHPLS